MIERSQLIPMVVEQSPKGELFSMIAKQAEGKWAFLSFDDEVYSKEKIQLNTHYEGLSIPPKECYDGVLLFPQAHYLYKEGFE